MAHLSHGGIDVASDRLDVMLLPDGQCFWVGNNAAGWAELVSRLRGLCIAAIGIEASGGYERGVIRALLQKAFLCGRSIRSSFASLPGRVGFWPRTIGWMPD